MQDLLNKLKKRLSDMYKGKYMYWNINDRIDELEEVIEMIEDSINEKELNHGDIIERTMG